MFAEIVTLEVVDVVQKRTGDAAVLGIRVGMKFGFETAAERQMPLVLRM